MQLLEIQCLCGALYAECQVMLQEHCGMVCYVSLSLCVKKLK